jgi:hypothetical protein
MRPLGWRLFLYYEWFSSASVRGHYEKIQSRASQDISDVYFQTCKSFQILKSPPALFAPAQGAAESVEARDCQSVQHRRADRRSWLDIILNPTVPEVHARPLAAMEAGKHVYSEKPWQLRNRGRPANTEAARSRNLYAGCARYFFLAGCRLRGDG